jgi:hypothetical protein
MILKMAENGHLVRKLFQPEEFYEVLQPPRCLCKNKDF